MSDQTRISKAFVSDAEQLAEIDAARRLQWSKPVPLRDMTDADIFEVGKFYKCKSYPICVAVVAIVSSVLYGPGAILAECWPSDCVNFFALRPKEITDYQEISQADWLALWFPPDVFPAGGRQVADEPGAALITQTEN